MLFEIPLEKCELSQAIKWLTWILKKAIHSLINIAWEHFHELSSVQSLSGVQLFVTPSTAARQASLSITNSQSLLKLMSIELVMPSNNLILCRPLIPSSIFPSIRVFSNESALRIRWPKYWCLSFSISPFNEYSGLISFRLDWFDLPAVQRTLKSLLKQHSSKASIYVYYTCTVYVCTIHNTYILYIYWCAQKYVYYFQISFYIDF